jgi:hypothetical protein
VSLLDRAQILDLLAELSDELAHRGARAEVFLVGGAAIALAYDTRRATRDLDAVSSCFIAWRASRVSTKGST